ncbi:MAG: VOC family protein [Deltaproteobacteria bacterium]|nr:VOC family protein [Deltaproteobacteria bacterium]
MSGEDPIEGIQFRIRHTMLPVSDLDRTIDFYTRLFGMDVMRLREQPGERVGYLGYGCEDEGPALELIQTGTPGQRGQMPPWAGHVAIYVSDLYKLCEILRREGVKFITEPGPVRPGSQDHVAFIKDPDGYTLELTERHTLTGPPLKRSYRGSSPDE